jgi:GT2 family glycosyltransferase
MTRAIDIVIVNFNTRDDLLACLASIADAPPACPVHVHVVDNASSDHSVDAVRRAHPTVNVIALERNVGFAAANNIAIRASGAPLILLLNSDTRVRPGAIDTLVARLDATGAAIVGPRLVNGEGRPEISFGSMLSPVSELGQMLRGRVASRNSGWARRYVERRLAHERAVDWVSGACLLVKREAATAAGLLDERFFMYEEDVDFCASVRKHGGRVMFTPHAEVVHLRGRSPAAERRRTEYDRSHVAFYEKHAPGWVPWLRFWLQLRR